MLKTALLCWQKSFQRYISNGVWFSRAPFLVSYGAGVPQARHTDRCLSKRTTTELFAWWCLAQKPEMRLQLEIIVSLCCIKVFSVQPHFPAHTTISKTYGPNLWITQTNRIVKAAIKARAFRLVVRVMMVSPQKACHSWLIHRRIIMVHQGWRQKDK